MLTTNRQRGDTIIEVLLAVTIFSMVAVGSIAIMGRSANAAQQAIEVTLVRQQIDSQVEALRAAHQAYSRLTTEEAQSHSTWAKLMDAAESKIDDSEECPDQTMLNVQQAYVMDPLSAAMLTLDDNAVRSIDAETAPIYPQVVEDEDELRTSYGLWIERQPVDVGPSGGFSAAYDFRVRACWYGAGMGKTPMHMETVVRLYES